MTSETWQKIKEIFYFAIELPKSERREFARLKCADDHILLAEIEKLLDSHEADLDIIETNSITSVKNFLADESQKNIIGKNVGAYRIEREIGRGGMGAVYLASRDDGEFSRQVAVKLIKRGLDTDEIIRRFRHERQILANLEHPNITRLLDGGTTESGLPFLVMDYVEGSPLNIYCGEQKTTLNRRLELFLEICSAVNYAHQNLTIHRDLKPSNILVTPEGSPKLLDFGIAKLLASNDVAITRQTLTDLSVMTPEYASPEQVSGVKVTTATDIYSLGVILYEMLTGVRPYSLKNQSLERVIYTICEFEPLRPSFVLSRRLSNNPESKTPSDAFRNPKLLRGDLDNIVLMAMRKEPERRYSSVEQFAEDIRRYLNGLPVIAHQTGFMYRTAKFIKRNKTGVIAGGGIAVSLVFGVVSTLRQSRIARSERDRALREAEKAEKINKFLKKMLNSADPRAQGKDVKVMQVLDIAAVGIETDFAAQPEIIADLRSTIGLIYLNLALYDKAEPHLRESLRIRRDMFGERCVETAMSLNNVALLLKSKGDLNSAEPIYRKALKILEGFREEHELEFAAVLHNFGYLLGLAGKFDETERIYNQALEIRLRRLGENHQDTAKTLGELGNMMRLIENFATAESYHRRALSIFRRIYGDEHPDVGTIMSDLAGVLRQKNPRESEKLCREALEMRRKVLGEQHPDVAWSLYDLAFLLIQRGEADEAEEKALRVLALRGITLTDEHPLINSSLLVLGRAFMAQNKLEEAEKALRECLDLRCQTLQPDNWLIFTTVGILGECLMLRGQSEKALPLIFKSYENLREKLGQDHEQTRIAKERYLRFNISNRRQV